MRKKKKSDNKRLYRWAGLALMFYSVFCSSWIALIVGIILVMLSEEEEDAGGFHGR